MTDKDAPLPVSAEEKPSLFKSPISAGVFCEALALLALVVTWLGSLGEYHWALDLLSHFRLQYVVVCASALVFGALRRSVVLVLAALVSLLWNAQLIHAVHRTAGPAPSLAKPAGKPLKVLVFNVLAVNDNHVAAIDHVLNVDADIVCLPEAREDWRLSLEPLRVRYPYRVEELGDGDFSIACYTRLPLKSSEVRRFPPWRLPTILLNLDYLGTPITFIGTHPMPPMTGERAAGWREQLGQIGALVAGIDGDVIVGGDLNATPWCHGMRLLCGKSGLGFHSFDPVWVPTWGRHLPVMIPIDHVLTKGSFIIRKRHIGPPMGSDHRSVMVELVR
ncbi:MAG: endonuclease/exonuclease/phosphatase family protein [Prosthecobacter sp.]